ncbi:MAG: M28 family metallopeptidase [Vicinamibacterales bacterium]
MVKSVAAFAAVLIAMSAGGCTREPPPPEGVQPGPTPAIARMPIGAMPDIDPAAVLAHTKVLASDRFEGRAPGTRGEELTVDYIATQFRAMGLKPGNNDGRFVQRVPLVGITPEPVPLIVHGGSEERQLKWNEDVVAWTKHVAESAAIESSELVFVGYGIVAPEYGWDDYKDVDVTGKTLVMLVNDPPIPDPGHTQELDPKVFGGRAMTYYGRWTYKYEIAAKKGAAAALIVHETGPAGYPFSVLQSKGAEQFDLVTPDKNMGRVAVEGWITLDRARDLLRLAGQDFGTLKQQAATREFKPVPLGITASMTITNTLRTINSRNVVARLDGSDPALSNEYVVYTAHWDHLGVGPEVGGDDIYNGAVDNAVGVAGLIEIARAFTKLPKPPKRSIVFLAVTAEEQGLLGSQYYAMTPIYPLARTAADINIDGLNVSGRTLDLTVVGYGASDLDEYARDAAGEQGRVIRPDPEPEKGFYYRSDHFNFAKEGVPALHPDQGIEYIGKPKDYGVQVRSRYNERDYHQPSDEVRDDWDLAGAAEDLKVFFAVGYRVAEAARLPEWAPGSEFRAKREAMLESR